MASRSPLVGHVSHGQSLARIEVLVKEVPMTRVPSHKLSLWESLLCWQHFPEITRQQAIDVLTTLCLEVVSLNPVTMEPDDNEPDHSATPVVGSASGCVRFTRCGIRESHGSQIV